MHSLPIHHGTTAGTTHVRVWKRLLFNDYCDHFALLSSMESALSLVHSFARISLIDLHCVSRGTRTSMHYASQWQLIHNCRRAYTAECVLVSCDWRWPGKEWKNLTSLSTAGDRRTVVSRTVHFLSCWYRHLGSKEASKRVVRDMVNIHRAGSRWLPRSVAIIIWAGAGMIRWVFIYLSW